MPPTDNYLIDAILDVPRTRQMYVRRLRTLMDAFQPTGRLQVGGGAACTVLHIVLGHVLVRRPWARTRGAAPHCLPASPVVHPPALQPALARRPAANHQRDAQRHS